MLDMHILILLLPKFKYYYSLYVCQIIVQALAICERCARVKLLDGKLHVGYHHHYCEHCIHKCHGGSIPDQGIHRRKLSGFFPAFGKWDDYT